MLCESDVDSEKMLNIYYCTYNQGRSLHTISHLILPTLYSYPPSKLKARLKLIQLCINETNGRDKEISCLRKGQILYYK